MPFTSVTSPSANQRVYTNPDGTTCTFTGGTVAWRDNNPGNIHYGPVAESNGAIGQDSKGFAIFADQQDGLNALNAVVTQTYGSSTINGMMSSYAPSFENNTTAYQSFLANRVGVAGTTAISALTADQRSALINGIVTYEGTRPGTMTGTGCGPTGNSNTSSLDATTSDNLDVAYTTDASTGSLDINYTDNGTLVGTTTINSAGNFIDSVKNLNGTTIETVTDSVTSPNTFSVTGSNFNMDVGDAAKVTISGSNIAALATGAGASLTLAAGDTGDVVNANSTTVQVAANSSVTLNGSGNTINGSASDNITIGGNGSAGQSNFVYVNGATVNIENSSRSDIFGSGNTVDAGASDNYGVYGAGNTINSQSSSNVWIGNYGASGASDQVNANGCVVTVGDDFSASIAGAGTVAADSYDNLATYGDNTHITVSGQNTTMNNYGASDVTTADGSNDVTNNHGYDDVTYNYGSGDDTYDYGTGEHNYNYGSDEYGWAASSSDSNYDANSSDTGGGYGYDPGGGGYYGYYGYYGFAGKPAANDATKGSNIGSIAQFDKAHGKPGAAAVAQKAQAEIGNAIAHDAKVAFSGAKWDNNTVTWSVGNGGDFSGSMSPSEVQAVKQAFAEWSAATGLNFEEVASTDSADITVGMGSFDTSNTGVVGFTTFRAKAGHIQPGAVVRVEDVSEDPLVSGADGASVYGGTDATFSQALQHEIGHALGFGDNADPTSVESYYLSAANRTLSSNDIAQAAALYGGGTDTARQAHQIIQAMSSFAPAPMASATAANDPDVFFHSALYSGNHIARRAY